MTRDEHLAWAKTRAREYLDRGDNPGTAIASLLSDLAKHERWHRPGEELLVLLMRAFLADPSASNARRLIDRFGEPLNTTRLPVDHCPWCGYELDAMSPFDGKATPKPGDLGMCISCASFLEFGADLRVQKITDAAVREALSAEAYDELMQGRRALLSMDRTKLSQRGRK